MAIIKSIIRARDKGVKFEVHWSTEDQLIFFHQACVSIEDGYLPKVTFVVVQKRHHTRLFPVNPKETDRSGNIMPGFFNIFLNAAGIYYHLNLSLFADFVVLNCQRNRGRHRHLSP